MALKDVAAPTAAPAEEAPPIQVEKNELGDAFLPALAGELFSFNLTQAPRAGNLLPQVKIPYPIEMDGTRIKGENIYKLGLFDGETFQNLPDGTIITTISGRDAARKLLSKVGPDGQVRKEFVRAFAPLTPAAMSAEAFNVLVEESKTDASVELGISFAVAVVLPDGSASIAEVAAFKIMKEWWLAGLKMGVMKRRMGIQIPSIDFTSALQANKTDPTKKYLSPKKFKYVDVVLDDGHLSSIKAALEVQLGEFQAWQNR